MFKWNFPVFFCYGFKLESFKKFMGEGVKKAVCISAHFAKRLSKLNWGRLMNEENDLK